MLRFALLQGGDSAIISCMQGGYKQKSVPKPIKLRHTPLAINYPRVVYFTNFNVWLVSTKRTK